MSTPTRAVLHTQINPGGGTTTYHFEYGSRYFSKRIQPCQVADPDVDIGSGIASRRASTKLSRPRTGHHLPLARRRHQRTRHDQRWPDRTFTTFPSGALLTDPCPNAHVRQQTGAALLLDCRAYELVSAADTGGYDVESDLVAGPDPLRRLPAGREPAPGPLRASTTAASPAPATRPTAASTPTSRPAAKTAGAPPTSAFPPTTPSRPLPFSSTPSGADSSLDTFAFGGAGRLLALL